MSCVFVSGSAGGGLPDWTVCSIQSGFSRAGPWRCPVPAAERPGLKRARCASSCPYCLIVFVCMLDSSSFCSCQRETSTCRKTATSRVVHAKSSSLPPKSHRHLRNRVFAMFLFAEFLKELAAIAQEHSILPERRWRRVTPPIVSCPAHVIAPIKHLWTLSIHFLGTVNSQLKQPMSRRGLMTSKTYRRSVFLTPCYVGSNRPHTSFFINFLKYSTIISYWNLWNFSISIMNVHVKFRHMDVFGKAVQKLLQRVCWVKLTHSHIFKLLEILVKLLFFLKLGEYF